MALLPNFSSSTQSLWNVFSCFSNFIYPSLCSVLSLFTAHHSYSSLCKQFLIQLSTGRSLEKCWCSLNNDPVQCEQSTLALILLPCPRVFVTTIKSTLGLKVENALLQECTILHIMVNLKQIYCRPCNLLSHVVEPTSISFPKYNALPHSWNSTRTVQRNNKTSII